MGKPPIYLSEEDELEILRLANNHIRVYTIARLTNHCSKTVRLVISRKRPRTEEERFEIQRPSPTPEEISLLASIERVRHLEEMIDCGSRKSPVKREIVLEDCFIDDDDENPPEKVAPP